MECLLNDKSKQYIEFALKWGAFIGDIVAREIIESS